MAEEHAQYQKICPSTTKPLAWNDENQTPNIQPYFGIYDLAVLDFHEKINLKHKPHTSAR